MLFITFRKLRSTVMSLHDNEMFVVRVPAPDNVIDVQDMLQINLYDHCGGFYGFVQ